MLAPKSARRGLLNQVRRRRKSDSPLQATEHLEERQLLSSVTLSHVVENTYKTFPEQNRLGDRTGAFLTGPMDGDAQDIAFDYLRMHADELGATASIIDSARVDLEYVDPASGVTHLYLTQQVNGLDVSQSVLNINIAEDGEVMNAGSSFVADTTAPDTNPGLTAIEALTSLVNEFGWEFDTPPEIVNREGGTGDKTEITKSGISLNNITAELKYVYTDDGLDLAWQFEIYTVDSQSYYVADVSATDGSVDNLYNYVAHASYNVWPLPFENPQDGGVQSLQVDPHDAIASPFGWHDTNGAAGAESTETVGNNVEAQEDKNGDNTPGANSRPDGGANLIFDFDYVPTENADTQEELAVTSLFYWNNIVHDVTYQYGFDEVAGNFQTNNYGNGGFEGDPVQADALDAFDQGARGNANFLTLPDGVPGSRMQMFVFDNANPTRTSDLSAMIIIHEFGHGLTNRLTGGALNVGALNAAQARGMGEGWSDLLGLLMTQKAADQQFDTYPVGNWVLDAPQDDPNGGIRRFPYTFDMSINPLTYGDFNPFSAPHPNGEIMAVTMWDLNWFLINGDGGNIPPQGFDPDVYNGTGGNNLTMQLFHDALKLQPANPTFLDFRDAVLLADNNLTGGQNQLAIWTAFARRGMGWSAFDGTPNGIGIQEAFDLPPDLLFRMVIDQSSLTNGAISETDGPSAAVAQVRRGSTNDVNVPMVVSITTDDDTEVGVPDTVTIPAGRTFVNFSIDAIDDNELDGTQTARITVSTPGQNPFTELLDVTDFETVGLTIDADSVREDAGANATFATVTRSNTDTDPPNIFVSVDNELREYDRTGTLLTSEVIPHSTGTRPGGETSRDLVVTSANRVAVYNGTVDAELAELNQNFGFWGFDDHPDLSTDGAIAGSGGIAAYRNFVFMTDMNTPGGEERGLVRFDRALGRSQRFGRTVPGERLFASVVGPGNASSLVELDPRTGEVINDIPAPTTAEPGTRDGMAYDGTNLWYLASNTNFQRGFVYRLDPDTGNVRDTYDLGDTGFDGIAVLNGLVYLQDNNPESDIHVFDPVAEQLIGVLDIDGVNPGIEIAGGLAGLPGEGVLLATAAFGSEIYAINPSSALVERTFASAIGGGQLGLGVVNNQVYVGSANSDEIEVYSTDGDLVRTFPVDNTVRTTALGSDGVQGAALSPFDYIDVTVGLDDLVYALDKDGQDVSVYDPDTLQSVGFLTLDVASSAISVNAFGEIFTADANGFINHFDANGGLISQFDTTFPGLIDIDLTPAEMLVSNNVGDVVLVDNQFANPVSFSTGGSAGFVSFTEAPGSAAGDLRVRIINTDPSEISVPDFVTIPAGSQSVEFPVDAVDDFLFDGTQTATLIIEVAEDYQEISGDSVEVVDVEGVVIDIDKDAVLEDDGLGAATILVSRSNVDGPLDASSDLSTTSTPTLPILDRDTVVDSVTIPPQLARVRDVNVEINLTHDQLGDLDVYLISPAGTRVELFTDVGNNGDEMTGLVIDDEARDNITSGSAPFTGRFQPESPLSAFDGEDVSGTWMLEITDDTNRHSGILESWTLGLTGAGFPELEVTLVSSDGTEAEPSVQVVTIPENQLSTTIALDAIDDNVLDGTQTVSIIGSAPLYFDGGDSVDVEDAERLTITVDPGTISESDGADAAIGTITRSSLDELSDPVIVTLDNRDPSEISIPATVTIPAGEVSATFSIDAEDDALQDGRQRVRIDATAPGFTPDLDRSRVFMFVEDSEPVLVVELAQDAVFENEQFLAGTVTRVNSSITDSLSVSLNSNRPSDMTLPSSITIPAGRETADFTITLRDNNLLDGDRSVVITADAAGTFSGEAALAIMDYETLTVGFSPIEFTENDGEMASVGTVTRNNTDVGSELVVALTSSDTSEATVPATVTIPAGESSATFDIAAVNDSEFDGAQVVTIDGTAGGYIAAAGELTVVDHEPPVLTGPARDQETSRPEVTWDAIVGATRYHLRIDSISTGESGVINETNLPGDIDSFTPETLLPLGKYRARLRYYDAQERLGPWSDYQVFFVRTAPGFTSPGAISQTNPPNFEWTAIVDASHYELLVTDLTNGERVVNEKELAGTNFTPSSLPQSSYEAQVRAVSTTGFKGNWGTLQFSILDAPVILTPQSGPTWDTQPTITWTASEGATHYDVRIHDLTLGLDNGGQNIVRDRFVQGTEFTPDVEFEVGHKYRIYVSAFSAEGLRSKWSPSVTIAIGDRPRFLAPGEGAQVDQFPVFRWTEVVETKRYDFRIREVGKNNNLVRARNVQSTAYSHPVALDSGKSYRAWVRSVSVLGQKTRWSPVLTFMVASSNSEFDNWFDAQPTDATVAPGEQSQPPAEVVAQLTTEAPVIVNSYVDTTSPASQTSVPFIEAAGEMELPAQAEAIDAVMQEFPAIDADWWVEEEQAENASDFADETSEPLTIAAGLLAGAMVTTAKRDRKRQR